MIARLDAEAEEIAVDRARIALDDAAGQARPHQGAAHLEHRHRRPGRPRPNWRCGNAELALRDAELALERRSIVAPIAGIVGILPVEAGNYVTTQTAIATIDDRSRIVVDFWVPERYASAVAVGAAADRLADRPAERGLRRHGQRRRQPPRRGEPHAAGAGPHRQPRRHAARRHVVQGGGPFPGDTYPAVSPLAIQWGTDGAFVWVVREGKAKRTPVRIIQRNTENVLVDAAIGDGDHWS